MTRQAFDPMAEYEIKPGAFPFEAYSGNIPADVKAWDSGVLPTIGEGASGGAGARTVAITVNNGGDTPLPLESAKVRLTKGAESYLLKTNASGLATFALDDGTWAVVVTLAGYSFTPTTLVVDADTEETYSLTAWGYTPSTQPDTVTIRWLVIGSADFLPVGAGVSLVVRIKEGPGTDGYAWGKGERIGTTDANGMVEFANVPVGATIRARLGAASEPGEWYDLTIPSDATSPYDAGEIIGVAVT